MEESEPSKSDEISVEVKGCERGMEPSRAISKWNRTTSRLAVAAKAPFLFFQRSRTNLSARNLDRGHNLDPSISPSVVESSTQLNPPAGQAAHLVQPSLPTLPQIIEGVSEDASPYPSSDGIPTGKSDLPDKVETPEEKPEPSSAISKLDRMTARLANSATLPFLFLQGPQIILNTQNLLKGHKGALFAVAWMGQLTGLVGNLTLLSYFAGKKERGAMIVQAVGVLTTLVVLCQLAIAGAMPTWAFILTASVVAVGLIVNLLNYVDKLNQELWRVWGQAITVGALIVLPQVIWSTFKPYLPPSIVPGAVCGALAGSMVVLARLGKLPPLAKYILKATSAWTATLLFMWAPLAQLWRNYRFPANIRGLSVYTILLAMVGNSLLLPRALFTRDLMWFTGSGWGACVGGWGILVSMFQAHVISSGVFYGASGGFFLWLSTMLWVDSKAYDLRSPLVPLVDLVKRKKRHDVDVSKLQNEEDLKI